MPASSLPSAASTGVSSSPAAHAGAAIISAIEYLVPLRRPPRSSHRPSSRIALTGVPVRTLAGSIRATIAFTNWLMPPRNAVKIAGAARFGSWLDSFAAARAFACAPPASRASASRTSSPSPPAAATLFARSVARRRRRKSRSAADRPADPPPPAQSAASPAPQRYSSPPLGRGGCSSSSPIRILVRNPNSRRHRRRNQLRRHQEHQPIGQRHQPIAHHNIGLARRIV